MKTKTAHTPGPWEQAPCFMIQSKKGEYICRVDSSEGSEHHANARLIVAAPDMLDALDNTPIHRLDETPEQFIERYKQWYRETRNAAIAKALGQ